LIDTEEPVSNACSRAASNSFMFAIQASIAVIFRDLTKFGRTIATNMPIIATTIKTLRRVNVFLFI